MFSKTVLVQVGCNQLTEDKVDVYYARVTVSSESELAVKESSDLLSLTALTPPTEKDLIQ